MNKTALTTACALTLAAGAPAHAESYDLQSTFPLQVPSIGQSPVHWAEKVAMMTDGAIEIEVHGAGEFVPSLEVFGAVSSGALPMGFDWIGYWADQIPVANLVGSMPFGPAPEVALAWMFEGGGLEIIQRAYDPYDVKIIPCHLVASEAGGWFNKEINSVEDLEGLNMRISGLGGKALARLGANTQMIPAGELYVSLERGRIDALEFSAPALDVGFGFQEVADYYYFPGWHQPSSWDSIIINMDVWNGFSEREQGILVEACKANITERLAEQLDAQADAIEQVREAGVEIRRFPDEVLTAIRAEAEAVMAEEAERDDLFAEAYESLREYAERVGSANDLQSLPR
ncbi:TRAP transporter substrate-binding protein [Arhodomonas sp. SL1]|uniref:TRAP transporter substrate-binding protein n=1 Tax=Arhodomonas sp. SL1 TaxID=3425691 RepID=UPI003F884F01